MILALQIIIIPTFYCARHLKSTGNWYQMCDRMLEKMREGSGQAGACELHKDRSVYEKD